jgi:hypothetical protein
VSSCGGAARQSQRSGRAQSRRSSAPGTGPVAEWRHPSPQGAFPGREGGRKKNSNMHGRPPTLSWSPCACLPYTLSCTHVLILIFVRRKNLLGSVGWIAVTDALEMVTSLTSLNGCDLYTAIRRGELAELNLKNTELGVWAARFLERSASTLVTLDVRFLSMLVCFRIRMGKFEA